MIINEKLSDSVITDEVRKAFRSYTRLSDYSSKGITTLRSAGKLKDLMAHTQSKLPGNMWAVRAMSNFYVSKEYPRDYIGDVFEFPVATSFSKSEDKIPWEYKKYLYRISVRLPKSKVLAHSDITPELFSLSEGEIITDKMKLKITNVYTELNGDTGEVLRVDIDCRVIS